MGETLKTTTGVEIRNIVSFLWPAAQFEASQGSVGRFSDIAYCYRARLQERQEFFLQGRARGMQAHYNIIMYNLLYMYMEV